MLLLLPASFCVALLFMHSMYMRPFRATVWLFAAIIPASMLYGGAGFYKFNVASPTIPFLFLFDSYPVPVMNMVGFIFTFYCGVSLALRIYENQATRTAPFFRVIVAIVFIDAFIGLAIEYVNLSAKWWYWTTDKTDSLDFGTLQAVLRLFGVWAWRSLLIFPILLQFFIPYPTPAARRKAIAYCLAWFAFFLVFVMFVDVFPILRPIPVLMWLLLPWLAIRFPKPEIDLRLIQFNRPMPLRPRLDKWRRRHETSPA